MPYLPMYILLEDGSETTVSSALLSSARSSCRNRCQGASAANVFYALKSVTEGEFKCKCVDTLFASIIAEERFYSIFDNFYPIYHFYIEILSNFFRDNKILQNRATLRNPPLKMSRVQRTRIRSKMTFRQTPAWWTSSPRAP